MAATHGLINSAGIIVGRVASADNTSDILTKGLKRALASLLDNIGGGGALCVRATENQFYAATSGFTPSTPELNRLFLVPPEAARPFSRQTSSNQAFDCVPEKDECEAAVPRLFEDLPLGARATGFCLFKTSASVT